jgi:hypothetical protein
VEYNNGDYNNRKPGSLFVAGIQTTYIEKGRQKLEHFKSRDYFTYHQVQHSKILQCAHIAFMCFVRISQQTVTFAVYISRLVLHN